MFVTELFQANSLWSGSIITSQAVTLDHVIQWDPMMIIEQEMDLDIITTWKGTNIRPSLHNT